jgi:hypothetical protein
MANELQARKEDECMGPLILKRSLGIMERIEEQEG